MASFARGFIKLKLKHSITTRNSSHWYIRVYNIHYHLANIKLVAKPHLGKQGIISESSKIPAGHGECTSLKSHHQIWIHQTYILQATILHLKEETLIPISKIKKLITSDDNMQGKKRKRFTTNMIYLYSLAKAHTSQLP